MTRLALLIPFLVLLGCSAKPTPIPPADLTREPALRTIARDYTRIVRDLHDRDHETWHHDWTGNIFPNTLGGRHKGLCFEWQAEVWRGIEPTLDLVKWQGVGLAANADRWTEHHVVVVFDPARLSKDELIPPLPPGLDLSEGVPQGEAWGKRPPDALSRPAWVLDPWHTGTPEIYTLDEWLIRGTAEWFTLTLEPLP
jgi:hypothetical protein